MHAHRVHTEWQRPLSGVHSIIRVKSAQAGEGGKIARPQSTQRVATAAFWRTFHHDGKISPGWWGWGVLAHPLPLYQPSRTKLWFTLQLRGQIHSLYCYSTSKCLCGKERASGGDQAAIFANVGLREGEGGYKRGVWLQKLEKVLIWVKSDVVSTNFRQGVKKCRILLWFQNSWKLQTKLENLSNKKVRKFGSFYIFTRDHKIEWVITFWGKLFFNFFTGFGISMKFCVFWYPIWYIF